MFIVQVPDWNLVKTEEYKEEQQPQNMDHVIFDENYFF